MFAQSVSHPTNIREQESKQIASTERVILAAAEREVHRDRSEMRELCQKTTQESQEQRRCRRREAETERMGDS